MEGSQPKEWTFLSRGVFSGDGCCRKAKNNLEPQSIQFRHWSLTRERLLLYIGVGAKLHKIMER